VNTELAEKLCAEYWFEYRHWKRIRTSKLLENERIERVSPSFG
jgi:hypothetical protein